jgi:hypothetical protein
MVEEAEEAEEAEEDGQAAHTHHPHDDGNMPPHPVEQCCTDLRVLVLGQ